MKTKVMLVDSSFPINSRNLKIYELLKIKYEVLVVTWNRSGKIICNPSNYNIFNKKAEIGNKFHKILYIYYFYKFVKSNIIKFNPDIVIASNWDMLFIVSLMKNRYKFKLIYENRDMVSSMYSLIKFFLEKIEERSMCKADAMIVASRFFCDNYCKFKNNIIILENKLLKNTKKFKKCQSNKFRISYVGTIRFFDVIKNLIDAIKFMDDIELNFYGSGPDENKLKNFVINNKINNVNFWGSFDYNEIGMCYAKTDLLWSVYPNTINSNKKYVIPNKYYESIYFGVPGIFPKDTQLGDLINIQNIGFTTSPYSSDQIKEDISIILQNRKIINEKIDNMNKINQTLFFEDDFNQIFILIDNYYKVKNIN